MERLQPRVEAGRRIAESCHNVELKQFGVLKSIDLQQSRVVTAENCNNPEF
jgi:hypothetical protein